MMKDLVQYARLLLMTLDNGSGWTRGRIAVFNQGRNFVVRKLLI